MSKINYESGSFRDPAGRIFYKANYINYFITLCSLLANENFLEKPPKLVVFLVISIVKSSIALSLGLVGALSIVRFLSLIHI